MPLYETILIVRQDVQTPQVEALATSFGELLTAQGGEVKKIEHWGLRTLAYRINKNRKGHYVMFNFDAQHAAIAELERNMSLNEDVLRFMTIRVEEHETGPAAPLRKEERSDRPGFGDRGGPDRGGADRGDRGGDRGDRPRRPRSDNPAGEGTVA